MSMLMPPKPNSSEETTLPKQPPVRIRVGLAPDFDPLAPGEVQTLLRKRLRIGALIALAGIALEVLSLVLGPVLFSSGSFFPFSLVINTVALAVIGALARILWRESALSISQLRMIELILLSTLVGIESWPLYQILQTWLPKLVVVGEFPVIALAHSSSLFWVTLIIGYGALVPNTWYRRVAVLTVMSLIPLAVGAIVGLMGDGVPVRMALRFLFQMGMWLAIAVSVSVYASHRIEVLRQQASEARKLGQYQLKRRLGVGGMGAVYLAEHVLLRRPCALKLIRPERAGDPNNLLRFEREVQATATLTHPNTVQIYDYGHTEDGTFYYVMEYLPGMTLEELVKQNGTLPPARAIHLLRQICGALREAHAIGMVHRDIKPGNVMVCERGGVHDTVKLLDFGLVLPQGGAAGAERLTEEGAVAGTPAYMSPEQAGGQEDLDPRSDIYSVGALTYFLLTGQPPFAGRSAVKMLAAHLYERPEPLTKYRPDVPADLQAAVLRCLAKNPAERFEDVDRLEAALAECHTGQWSVKEAAAWWRSQAGPNGRASDQRVNEREA
jgi:eukaryotic-like serine/threonine-protein kinase